MPSLLSRLMQPEQKIMMKKMDKHRWSIVILPVAIIIFSSIISLQYIMFGTSSTPEITSFFPKLLSTHLSVVFWTLFFLLLFFCVSMRDTFFMSSMAITFLTGCSYLLDGLGVSPASNQAGIQLATIHSRWAEWLITVPLLVLLLGDAIQLHPKYVLYCMTSQFFMVLVGYLGELSNVLLARLACFLILAILWVCVTAFFLIHCSFFISKSKTLDVWEIKLMLLCVLVVWLFFPVAFLLNLFGALSFQPYILAELFLDVFLKLLTLGVCWKLHSLLSGMEQKEKNDFAHEQNKMQTKFLRFVYHEIRNPFNTIMLGIDQLRDEVQTPDGAFILRALKKSAQYLNRIINDAVDLSQNQESLALLTQATDLRVLVRSVVREFMSCAKEKDITLEIHLDNSCSGKYFVDQGKVIKMFKSVLSNAIKFSAPSTTVKISLKVDGFVFPDKSRVCFSVKDCGPGIPEDIALTLFQPFSNARPGDFLEDEDRGSGLNLCITKLLADLMGAAVSFATEKNVGSTFFITIPCEQAGRDEFNPLEVRGSWSSKDFRVSRRSSPLCSDLTNSQLGSPVHSGSNDKRGSARYRIGSISNSKREPVLNLENFLQRCSSKRSPRVFGGTDDYGNKKNEVDALGSVKAARRKSNSNRLSFDSENRDGCIVPIRNEEDIEGAPSQRVHTSSSDVQGAPSQRMHTSSSDVQGAPSQRMHTSASNSDKTNGSGRNEAWDFFPDSKGMIRIFPANLVSPKSRACHFSFTSPTSNSKNSNGQNEWDSEKHASDAPKRFARGPLKSRAQSELTDTFLGTVREVTISSTSFDSNPKCKGHDGKMCKTADILIVDDVKSNVKLTSMILKKAGYTCDTAFNGLEAVEMAQNKQYQLIIMDNVMPVMTGIEATRRILSFDHKVTIVGMTGNVLQSDQDEFLKAGVKTIILKPADKAQLLEICGRYVYL